VRETHQLCSRRCILTRYRSRGLLWNQKRHVSLDIISVIRTRHVAMFQVLKARVRARPRVCEFPGNNPAGFPAQCSSEATKIRLPHSSPVSFYELPLFAQFFLADSVGSRITVREFAGRRRSTTRKCRRHCTLLLCERRKRRREPPTVASDDDRRTTGIDGCPMTRRPTFSAKRRDAGHRYERSVRYVIEHADGA
jgi:hypothetical protein